MPVRMNSRFSIIKLNLLTSRGDHHTKASGFDQQMVRIVNINDCSGGDFNTIYS